MCHQEEEMFLQKPDRRARSNSSASRAEEEEEEDDDDAPIGLHMHEEMLLLLLLLDDSCNALICDGGVSGFEGNITGRSSGKPRNSRSRNSAGKHRLLPAGHAPLRQAAEGARTYYHTLVYSLSSLYNAFAFFNQLVIEGLSVGYTFLCDISVVSSARTDMSTAFQLVSK
ncbi:hypothetical protein DPX16_21380 [Anabarilius grahami]|uniref:Uncharacterized protein n=1 Tax=Anabarilius grahami TaxID=495550 RepID=A0A3N0XU97_ANAGA|nr:hypothetical protein DPX16_21380 [Anabarilius grahami]